MDNIHYFGKTDKYYLEWLLNWNYVDDFVLDGKIEHIKEIIYRNNQKKIISAEAFTQTGDIYQQTERIKRVVKQPKIIIVIREPVELVISKYRYFKEKQAHKHEFIRNPEPY